MGHPRKEIALGAARGIRTRFAEIGLNNFRHLGETGLLLQRPNARFILIEKADASDIIPVRPERDAKSAPAGRNREKELFFPAQVPLGSACFQNPALPDPIHAMVVDCLRIPLNLIRYRLSIPVPLTVYIRRIEIPFRRGHHQIAELEISAQLHQQHRHHPAHVLCFFKHMKHDGHNAEIRLIGDASDRRHISRHGAFCLSLHAHIPVSNDMAAFLFGFLQSVTSPLNQKRQGLIPLGLNTANADPDIRHHASAVSCECLRHFLTKGLPFLPADFRQPDDEFISAVANGEILLPHQRTEEASGFLQHDIPRHHAQRIVDTLEIVDVKEQKTAAASGRLQQNVPAFLPIVQSGQAVPLGVLLLLQLLIFSLFNVAEASDHLGRLSGGILHQLGAHLHPPELSGAENAASELAALILFLRIDDLGQAVPIGLIDNLVVVKKRFEPMDCLSQLSLFRLLVSFCPHIIKPYHIGGILILKQNSGAAVQGRQVALLLLQQLLFRFLLLLQQILQDPS